MDQLSANDDLDEAWSNFCADNYTNNESNNNSNNNKSNDKLKKSPTQDNNTPKCSDIYISTKTIISYLTSQVNLREVFWKIPIIPYHLPKEGIIKKQMKFNSSSQEEVDNIMEKTKTTEKFKIILCLITNIINLVLLIMILTGRLVFI